MSDFIFRVLPFLALALLCAGIVFTSLGIAREHRRFRFLGMGLIAAFVVCLTVTVLLGLARM